MKQPVVSVVIPVYNGRDSIGQCLTSVFKQDYGPLETIVIDDASTDGSLQNVQSACSDKPEVRIISHLRNQGLASTLNQGLELANGDFVLVVHQDCEILETSFVARALVAMQEHPEIAAVTGRRIYDVPKFTSNEKLFMVANGHLSELEHNDSGTQDLSFVEDKCDMYRKSVLQGIRGFPARSFRISGEDQVASSKIRGQGYRLVKLGAISYQMGFGTKESSIRGILGKLRVYGRTQAGVLWTVKASAFEGVTRENGFVGRALNRLQMLLSATVIVTGIVLSLFSPYFLLLSLGAFIARSMTYLDGLAKVNGRLKLAFLGPLLDLSYSFGFLEGILSSSVGRRL